MWYVPGIHHISCGYQVRIRRLGWPFMARPTLSTACIARGAFVRRFVISTAAEVTFWVWNGAVLGVEGMLLTATQTKLGFARVSVQRDVCQVMLNVPHMRVGHLEW